MAKGERKVQNDSDSSGDDNTSNDDSDSDEEFESPFVNTKFHPMLGHTSKPEGFARWS